MAGIYVHIPFCKKICYYCDFYFSLTLRNKEEIVNSICKELILRHKDFKYTIETIYFGGGTPSVLDINELEKIFNTIYKYYDVKDSIECTLEANPDDLSKEYIKNLKSLGINRLSIGIQSFFDEDLKLMNRRHTAKEAEDCLNRCIEANFDNLTADLMYGLPNSTIESLEYNINKITSFPINHISAYHLSIEPKTAFNKFVKTGKIKLPSENLSVKQFSYLINRFENLGYEQYEISNFAKNNSYSKHNLNYWEQVPYLGIGPSAHSYYDNCRIWNIANNREYIYSLNENKLPSEKEELSRENVFNEYVFTRLRTKWGISLEYIETNFKDFLVRIEPILKGYKKENQLIENNNFIVLTESGKFIADRIASDLFIV